MTDEQAVKSSPIYKRIMAEAESPSHSYMIVTPDTVTSELCAEYLVSALSKGASVESKDVYMLPFGDKVLTSDADFIGETAYIMPSELGKKYFIVRRAETAVEAAQNKLLKILEEPPETAVIILLCAVEYAMLPTVRSRCRMISPPTYPDEVMKSVIEEEYDGVENPSLVLALSGGSLSGLKAAAESGNASFEFALKMLSCMRRSGEILPYATALTKKGEISLSGVLDSLELIMRDCLAYAASPRAIWLKGNVMDIREISRQYTPDVVLKVMPVIMRAKKRILGGGNVNSIVDELLFSILEEKAKCQK